MKQGVFRGAIATVVQTVLSSAMLFVLYRFLLRSIGASSLGVWSVVLAATSASRISDFGLGGSVVRFVARYRARDDSESAAGVIETASIAIAVAFACMLTLCYPLLSWILVKIVPAAALGQARALLPYALLSMWFGGQAGVFQSGLDGCRRFEARNLLIFLSNALYLLLAIAFVPRYGLLALARVQVLQSAGLMIANWLLLRAAIGDLPLVPSRWSARLFKEMLSYGTNFQLVGLADMFCDFTTKAFLSRFGSLADVAYYDMASRMVTQVRSLLVAANQVTVPIVAAAHERSPERVRDLYRDSLAIFSYFAIPIFGALLAVIPAVSIVWIGRIELTFVTYAVILTVAWGLNSFNVPAYFANLATGQLYWNTAGHLTSGALNVVLGLVFGAWWGGTGVVVAWALALVLGSLLIVARYHIDHAVPASLLFASNQAPVVLSAVCAALASWLVVAFAAPHMTIAATALCIIASTIITVTPAAWLHPTRSIVLGKMLEPSR